MEDYKTFQVATFTAFLYVISVSLTECIIVTTHLFCITASTIEYAALTPTIIPAAFTCFCQSNISPLVTCDVQNFRISVTFVKRQHSHFENNFSIHYIAVNVILYPDCGNNSALYTFIHSSNSFQNDAYVTESNPRLSRFSCDFFTAHCCTSGAIWSPSR